MQRVLVILVVILLVTASLAAGALAANWPFWNRAWQWHAADGAVPTIDAGPRVIVRGAAPPLPFDSAAEDLAKFALASPSTALLMRLRDGHVEVWQPHGGADMARSPLDGRGLSVIVLEPLFAALAQQHPGLLDHPVGAWLEDWRQDPRGAHTPRELLAVVAGGIADAPVRHPLNPFRATARMASGPDFHGSAVVLFEASNRKANARDGAAAQATQQAAAAQVLAGIAAAVEQRPFADVLQSALWRGAQGDASLVLDRRRGSPALHCCLAALPVDWLRAGQWAEASALASGASGLRTFQSSGRALLASRNAVVLWVGEGLPPSQLETLLHPMAAPGP